jgi:hypothetical protein
LDFGFDQLTTFMFMLSYEVVFYELTVLKVHLPVIGIAAHATVPGYIISFSYK